MIYDSEALENKRLRIIKGAISVFSRRGFYQAKIEEIAEEAGVGKGTVYEYFSSKEELFLEMFLYIEEKCREMVQRELADVEPFPERLEKMFAVIMRFLKDYREMGQILFAGSPPVSEEAQKVLREKNRQMTAELIAMLEEAAAKGEIRPVNSRAAAQVIMGTLISVVGEVLFPEKKPGQEKIAPEDNESIEDNEDACGRTARDVVSIILEGLSL